MLKNLYLKFKFAALKAAIKKANYAIEDEDKETFSVLISINPDSAVLLSLNNEIVKLETTFIFNSYLINLKTLSSISHAAYFYGFSNSGILNKNQDQVKFYLAKEVPINSLSSRLKDELEKMEKCIDHIAGYISYRMNQSNLKELDLSMFEDIDLFLFDPRSLGEKKDFVYKDWPTYIESVENDDSNVGVNPEIMLSELKACAEFEKANDVLLSEIGDDILLEIIWNRRIAEMATKDSYSVN